MKLGFQISPTSFIHFGGFGFSTYKHPRSNEVEELVPKIKLKSGPNKNSKIYLIKQYLNI